jgi:hypothetical protein
MNIQSPNKTEKDVERATEALSSDIEQIKRMGEERLDDLRDLGGQLRQRIEDEVKARPLVALGVAFGAGALVTTIMTSRLARVAILAAGGYAAREMFGDRVLEVLGGREDQGEEPRRERRARRREREGGEGRSEAR